MGNVKVEIPKIPDFTPITVNIEVTFDTRKEIDDWKMETEDFTTQYSKELYKVAELVDDHLKDNYL